MPLQELKVNNFRIIKSADLRFSPTINLITGANGSGKTSLLESIHFVATARSFLSTRNRLLISRDNDGDLSVFARVTGCNSDRTSSLGMSLNAKGEKTCRIDGQNRRSAVESARELALFVVEPNSQLIVSGSPSDRRRFLDRGLFHVEPQYQFNWNRFRRSLEQRNALLRTHAKPSEYDAWNRELAVAADRLTHDRVRYLERVKEDTEALMNQLGFSQQLDFRYMQGWRWGSDLVSELESHLVRDRAAGFTSVGPHRSDFSIRVDGVEARGVLSRGQTKRIAALMILSQVAHYEAVNRRPAVLLIDDLGSELDSETQEKLVSVVGQCGAQVIANTLTPDSVLPFFTESDRVFHVEHGEFRAVL